MDEQKRRYLTIKLATEKYQLNPEYLSSIQTATVAKEVDKLYRLQAGILASDKAQSVTVSRAHLMEAYFSCVQQFESEEAFYRSLKHHGITVEGFKFALKDELHCDMVMELISTEIPELDIAQGKAYYNNNRLEFSRARTWKMSQILITKNDEFSENRPDKALARLTEMAGIANSHNFADLAMRHSECPSALEGGYLGWCEEGKLYSEITSALCSLPQGHVSKPIETELGFHLILCHEERPACVAPFEEVWPFLQEKHAARAKAYLQREWLQQLVC